MTAQDYIDRGIIGVIVQADRFGERWMSRSRYVSPAETERVACRCVMGHASGLPPGAGYNAVARAAFRAEAWIGERLANELMRAYDAAADIDGWRHRTSEILTEHGYDDSWCWAEVVR